MRDVFATRKHNVLCSIVLSPPRGSVESLSMLDHSSW